MNDEKKHSKVHKVLAEIFIWFFTIIGILLIVTAIFMPFRLRDYYKPKIENYKTIADLGTIGDFIGGTTVAFLTAASVFLLLATIIMQRKEIKISQQSIDELVKQTKASKEQAQEARKEAQITNETMKRQQFETTFFNMVSLHHNNTDKLSNKEFKGNDVIKDALKTFSDYYYEFASSKFKESYLADDYNEVVDFIKDLKMHGINEVASVQTSIKAEVEEVFEELDFRKLLKEKPKMRMLKEFRSYAYIERKEDLISEAYQKFEINFDGVLSSYFNSITTIIKFLSESEFEKEDKQNGTHNNKIYREILFSQFSPHEMMLIYYFVKYMPSNEWLLEELKTYNLFYPRLSETLYLFWSIDKKNIEELLGATGTE
ncbi:putative phage abortive infection protein [Priestia megaterium]|uniref:putative phage abortive infection protein n=1 Tax=Priestia megaterium TaxID=1404 RepID=UPI0021008CFC|nr:putative phage abortive infection protein [Priestia megaterium]